MKQWRKGKHVQPQWTAQDVADHFGVDVKPLRIALTKCTDRPEPQMRNSGGERANHTYYNRNELIAFFRNRGLIP